MSFLAVLGLYGGAAYLGRDVIAAGVNRTQDEVIGFSEHRAEKIEATSQKDDRSPGLANDGFSNRSWASKAGEDLGAELTAAFDSPFRLSYVVISPGASNVRDVFLKERRPLKMEITAVRADGGEASRIVGLQDNESRQSFYIGADEVSVVRIKILETTGPEGAPVSVAEIQFAGRR